MYIMSQGELTLPRAGFSCVSCWNDPRTGWSFTTLLGKSRLAGQARLREANPLQLWWLENMYEHTRKSWDLGILWTLQVLQLKSPGKTHQAVGMRLPSWLEVAPSSQVQPGTSTGGTSGYQARELINTEARSLHTEEGQPLRSCYEGRKQKQCQLLTAQLLLFGCFSKGPMDKEVTRATRNWAALPNTSPLAAETRAGTHGEAASGRPASLLRLRVPRALRNHVVCGCERHRQQEEDEAAMGARVNLGKATRRWELWIGKTVRRTKRSTGEQRWLISRTWTSTRTWW